MKLYILSIVDREGEQFGPLHLVKSLNIGMRMFMETLRNPQGDSMIQKYPESFSLMCVGHFDDETGAIEAVEGPYLVQDAVAALRIIQNPGLVDALNLVPDAPVTDTRATYPKMAEL